MTMYCIKHLFLILGLFVSNLILGQSNLTGYFEPDISLNYNIAPNYSHNFKIAQRSYIYEDNLKFSARQLDISHFSNLKIKGNQSVALGIQYRFREIFEDDHENELRFTEQFNVTHGLERLRFGNRFRIEQRIGGSTTTHRFRYRFAVDFPLNGEKLDVGESYVVFSTESLLSVSRNKKPEFDQRLRTIVGWLLNKETKFQTGIEYRSENYAQATEIVYLF